MRQTQQNNVANKALHVGLYVTMAVGTCMVVAPVLTMQFFGLLLFQDHTKMLGWPTEVQQYVKLAHAVMGSVMIGWATLMLLMSKAANHVNKISVVKALAVSLILWYLPDTVASILYGFWQNAAFNTGFLVMLMLPLYLPFLDQSKPSSLRGSS